MFLGAFSALGAFLRQFVVFLMVKLSYPCQKLNKTGRRKHYNY